MSFTTLTWGSDSDFSSVDSTINGGGTYTLIQSDTASNDRTVGFTASYSVEDSSNDYTVSYSYDTDGSITDGDTISNDRATQLNDKGESGTLSPDDLTLTGQQTITYGGFVDVEEGGDGGLEPSVDGGINGNKFISDRDGTTSFDITLAPFVSNGGLTGTSKTWGERVYIYDSVTVNGGNNRRGTNGTTSVSVTVTNDNGDSQTITDFGTSNLSLAPSRSASVSATLTSNGEATPELNNITVRAQPAIQVYLNGSWQYKPLSILATNGNEIIPSSIEHYDASSGVWT